MRNLGYRINTSLVLSNEYYTNKGLDREEMMKEIERIDGVWMVEKYPINSNIEVHIRYNSRDGAEWIVREIEGTLENMLRTKQL